MMDDKLEYFKTVLETDLLDLLFDIKNYLHQHSYGMLDLERTALQNDFVEFIFHNVKFDIPNDSDLVEEDEHFETY